MIWKAVESSQIAYVGYEPESQKMAIVFKPTKKQQEDGQAGSVYEYANVKQLTFDHLVSAASVGAYFRAVIKDDPIKYPYTKVS